METTHFKEKHLQKAVHFLMDDPAKIWHSTNNIPFQFLSRGIINPHEGPDFLDIALFIDGKVIVGNAEYHKKSSDWLEHSHTGNILYDTIVLHIVSNNNVNLNLNCETLVIEQDVLKQVLNNKNFTNDKVSYLDSLEDLQHFALIRLLRKSSEAQRLIKKYPLKEALEIFAKEFIKDYSLKRRRPTYNFSQLSNIAAYIPDSRASSFLEQIGSRKELSIPDEMQLLLKAKIDIEGAALRREIILNVILPMAICLSDEKMRIDLFLWYWSTPAISRYGLLARRFQDFPQNFLWQQQGMLEYIREHGKKSNIVTETIREYGFGEILSFYQIGYSPFKTN